MNNLKGYLVKLTDIFIGCHFLEYRHRSWITKRPKRTTQLLKDLVRRLFKNFPGLLWAYNAKRCSSSHTNSKLGSGHTFDIKHFCIERKRGRRVALMIATSLSGLVRFSVMSAQRQNLSASG